MNRSVWSNFRISSWLPRPSSIENTHYQFTNERPRRAVRRECGHGQNGLGKRLLRSLPIEKYDTATINMNFYTDAVTTQGQLEAPMEKRLMGRAKY